MTTAVGWADEFNRQGEVRITNGVTGGQKGSKPERMDLIPGPFLLELGRLYGKGAEKYSDHNWRKGVDYHLSQAALLRHYVAWSEGEDIDPETGCSHLASVAFHCASLITFLAEHPELDDRYKQPEPAWTGLQAILEDTAVPVDHVDLGPVGNPKMETAVGGTSTTMNCTPSKPDPIKTVSERYVPILERTELGQLYRVDL